MANKNRGDSVLLTEVLVLGSKEGVYFIILRPVPAKLLHGYLQEISNQVSEVRGYKVSQPSPRFYFHVKRSKTQSFS